MFSKRYKDGVEEWYYCRDILSLDAFILGKSKGKLNEVSNEDVLNYSISLLKLSGIGIRDIRIEGSRLALVDVSKKLASFEIPYGITSIGDECFWGCSSLRSIAIPNSVTSLGAYCFYYCISFQSITIPDSVTYIGGSCFSDCKSLQSVTIPDSVTSLGDGCFDGCRSLKLIKLPKRFKREVKDFCSLPENRIEYY